MKQETLTKVFFCEFFKNFNNTTASKGLNY